MGCIPWRDESMIRAYPTTRNGPLDSGRFPRKARHSDAALVSSYTTHNPEGNLGVRADSPASVASAPRGGVACNDAATRRDQPMIGWVRARCLRNAHTQTERTVMENRDLSWEALVRETHANPAMERGKLNSALKGIREAALTEGLTEEGLPEEIRLRAAAYRERWPQLTLTPNALAVHWFRVIAPVVEARSKQQIEIDKLRARINDV